MKSVDIKLLFISAIALAVASCGAEKTQVMLNTVNSPVGQTRPATFEGLRGDLTAAENDQVNLVAPNSFVEAKRYFQQAEADQAAGKSEAEYTKNLVNARKSLDAAIAFTKENKTQMAPLIAARKNAIEASSAGTTKDIEPLEKSYLSLVTDLESKGMKRDKALREIPDLTHRFEKITVKSVEGKYLGEAITNLNLAKREDARKFVPKTYKATEEAIKKANDYISQDQKSESMIAQLGKDAAFQSRRLLALNRQAKAWKDLSPEDVTLKAEALLAAVSSNGQGKDLRDLNFEAHAAALNEQVIAYNKEHSTVAQMRDQLATFQGKSQKYSKYEAEDQQNKKFESVRQLFDEQEAKVYRQGNTLVISLKKINFPTGTSQIPTVSFGLLKKVQSAIKVFHEPAVTVEGHTDSTGNATTNKTLSEARAEAIKAYLLSNNVTAPDKIEAIGYGSEKPLASNKSSAGRAINRRIDVVVKE